MIQKITLPTIFALFLCAIAQKTFAQASGVKPELIMYRHNSSASNSPLPILNGDILGTLKWNGLTAIGAVRTGAAIRSETKNVAPGIIAANMIFSSTNSGPLTDHIILTETGLVGIDIMAPQFNLDVHGNTHTSGRFYGRFHFDEFSLTNDPPNSYVDEAYFERKTRSALGVPAAAGINNFGGILTLAPGGGAHNHQLFFGQDGIWNRREVFSAGSWSGNWEKLLTNADIKGTPNRIARFLPPDNPSSTLGDSQLFDDGSKVGIGTVTPDPAFLLTVANDTKISGNLRTTGNALIDGSANTDALTVAHHTATNSLEVTTDATVNGATRLIGKVAIGANPVNTPGNHALYVGGSIVAEEVKVALQSNWPDYVFTPDYSLQPLSETEKYIQEHQHLPGVDSATGISQDGLDLGKMQVAQMEKIEELYLHLIAMEKRLNSLEQENQALKAALEARK